MLHAVMLHAMILPAMILPAIVLPAMKFPVMSGFARRISLLIAVLSLGGVVVSSVSLYHHYGTSQTSYCDFGESFNCDIVNRSIYSAIFGVPVALIGVIGYLGLLTLATFYRNRAETPTMLAVASLAGLGFAFYLTYIERFVLATWCVLCLSSLALIFSITLLSSLLWLHSVRQARSFH
jgi:uncharacterized membrane protein